MLFASWASFRRANKLRAVSHLQVTCPMPPHSEVKDNEGIKE